MSSINSLATYREKRAWSQAVLATRAAVSRTEISAIETGRVVPSVAVALRLATALQETVEAVFGDGPPDITSHWAWEPPSLDAPCWWATVDGRRLAFPVEHTAAGAIPHDNRTGGISVQSDALSHPDRTLVIAGCDPIVGFLAHEMAARHGIRVLPLLRSSAQALELLRRGVVHAAGAHFSDAAGRSMNEVHVKRALGRGYQLIHQVRWHAGIAVASARKERTVTSVLRANVRWVNREPGSAARQTFDVLLASRRRPSGYAHVVQDHRAVAATVSSGWAEAGICVQPAAAEARVRLIPLHSEAYELCLPDRLADDPRLVALVATLQSTAYRELLAQAPGCVSRETGAVRFVA